MRFNWDEVGLDQFSLPVMQVMRILPLQKQDVSNLKDLYMLKHADWQYENEFRIVRFGKQAFEPAEIKSITFGLFKFGFLSDARAPQVFFARLDSKQVPTPPSASEGSSSPIRSNWDSQLPR